ncbi:MAG: SH3 domain-containing protein [Clostridiales bacterium]|nr:SH3 domain-containing protein [Clostridiales bacterium]
MDKKELVSAIIKCFVILIAAVACVSAVFYFWDTIKKHAGDIKDLVISEPTPEPTPEPTLEASVSEVLPSPTPDPSAPPLIDYLGEGNNLELPVNGASGYASVETELYESPEGEAIDTLEPGQGFTIQEETGDWWRVVYDGGEGWVRHKICMINLPDVIPSIVYDNSNADSSRFKSSGVELLGITGLALYQSYGYNARLDRDEFTVPVLYAMAPKICEAQQLALADGNTLIIYEAFRPLSVQNEISDTLDALAAANPAVNEGLSTPPWSIRWFIANGLSTHQQGCAIDVSLGDAASQSPKNAGDYTYMAPDSYEEYAMPTEMHELSTAAVAFKTPVQPRVADIWRGVESSETMNNSAILLRKYCTDAGLTPLSSEWWHFDDVDCLDSESGGDYFISENYSEPPEGYISEVVDSRGN